MQEMSTRWWSILNMLQSIVFSNHPVILALADANRRELILTLDEVARVKELIKILEFFQHVGLELGKENEVTITGIDYWFSYLKDTVLKINQTDSPMLKDIKNTYLKNWLQDIVLSSHNILDALPISILYIRKK